MYHYNLCHLQHKFNSEYQLTRKTLGRYGLPGHAHTIKIRDLSGGQKARVVFAELALMQPDVLIMVSLNLMERFIVLWYGKSHDLCSSHHCTGRAD